MDNKIPGPWEALDAIRARISGQFDSPCLEVYGPLSTDTIADIVQIIKVAKESRKRDVTFDQYAGNAGAYFCSLCGGYDPHGATPYETWPVRMGVLIGHNPDCLRFPDLVDGRGIDPRGCGCDDCTKPTQANPHDIITAFIDAATIALIALKHEAPGSCWATGPLTGNPITDLVQCPGCNAITHLRAAIKTAKEGM